ncbi:hypothetical protein HYU15_00940 [Candidatus Woesearchaeota archaeon]|nr:hypothetical protein [Candidatus Woesearchaeota archaeon]
MARADDYDFHMPYEISPDGNHALNTGDDVAERIYWALVIHINDLFYRHHVGALVFEGVYSHGNRSHDVGVTLRIADGVARGGISVGHRSQSMAAEQELYVANTVMRTLEAVLLSPEQPQEAIG